MSERFDDVRRWIRALEENSRERRGYGYQLVWTEIEHRQLGHNRVPKGAVIPTREDALRLAGKQRQAERFARLVAMTTAAAPELREWIDRKPLLLLENADDWENVLAVLAWFRANPKSQVYLRQLDIAGVDTKFVEARKPLFQELLDLVLPDSDAKVRRTFEERFGLRSKPCLVRIRILDPAHHVAGLSDLTVPAAELDALQTGIRHVFITENEVNGLAFPEMPGAAVIFGLGYGLDRLVDVRWLRECRLHYWGDIDTHGFAMLDRLRAIFPDATALLMDRETLLEHRSMWVSEPSPFSGTLSRLSPDELRLFDDLAANRLGARVRLEQERIGFGWLTRALAALRG